MYLEDVAFAIVLYNITRGVWLALHAFVMLLSFVFYLPACIVGVVVIVRVGSDFRLYLRLFCFDCRNLSIVVEYLCMGQEDGE